MLCNKAYDYVLSAVFVGNVERIADLHKEKCITLVPRFVGPLLPKPSDTPVGVR